MFNEMQIKLLFFSEIIVSFFQQLMFPSNSSKNIVPAEVIAGQRSALICYCIARAIFDRKY